MDHRQINNLWINELLLVFSELGGDLDALTHGLASVKNGKLEPGEQLDLIDARTLWHRAVAAMDYSNLGVEIGRRLSPRSSGLIFPLLLHSPSVRKAIELLIRYQTLISENGRFRIIQADSPDSLSLEYLPAQSSVGVHPQHVLSVITATLKNLSLISAGRTKARVLQVPACLDGESISAALRVPVVVGGERYVIVLGTQDIDVLIQGRDEHLYQLLQGYADGLSRARSAGQGFLDHVKSHMESCDLVRLDVLTLATSVGFKKRTLQRHFDEQGTSFRKLKEGLLKEKVLDLLVVRQLPTELVAEELGYADVSTLHRAFKGWFGVTPGQFKSQIGS